MKVSMASTFPAQWEDGGEKSFSLKTGVLCATKGGGGRGEGSGRALSGQLPWEDHGGKEQCWTDLPLSSPQF